MLHCSRFARSQRTDAGYSPTNMEPVCRDVYKTKRDHMTSDAMCDDFHRYTRYVKFLMRSGLRLKVISDLHVV